MAKIKDAFKEIRESRERIIKAMQERGLTELNMIMTREEFAKENGLDPDDEDLEHEIDCDYADYRNQEAPYIIHMDKYEVGAQYDVLSVKLEGDRLKFECEGEYDNDWSWEDDVVYLTRFNVYERMENLLKIEDEPEKVWVFTQESNVDGEIHFNVIVCKDRETAVQTMEKEKEWIRKESHHFRGYDPNSDDFEIEESDDRFYINDPSDDYYEELQIEEKEIV